ncbi:MAG TPA: nitroreductase/quinone reductase family protein [Streptosporangiaceae bacterium]|nr:nitroreductase/quinone reductase family protein [Streptosporangiaceae bacterium]
MTVPVKISPYAETSVFFRAMRRMAGWEPVSRLFARTLPATDRFVSRITGRNITFTGLVSGLQVLLLTTTGATTGAQRTQPVLYLLRKGGDFVVIATNWGQEHNPSWYYNLRANPRATVTILGSTYDVIAHEVTGPERDLCWQQGCRMYPAWNDYKARAPHREFPVMILSRVA